MKQEEKKVSVMESCVVGAIKSECLGFGLNVMELEVWMCTPSFDINHAMV